MALLPYHPTMAKYKKHILAFLKYGVGPVLGFVLGLGVRGSQNEAKQPQVTNRNSEIHRSQRAIQPDIPPAIAEVVPDKFNSITNDPGKSLDLDVIDKNEGGLGIKFSNAVGLTSFEKEKVDGIMQEYEAKMKHLQLERLVEIEGSNGSKFMIPPLNSDGRILKDEFIKKVRDSIGGAAYQRLMAYGAAEIYSRMGNFGESKVEFSFKSDNEESVLDIKIGDSQDSRKGSSRYIGSNVPAIYAHLFTFDENN
ncbi:hypothetical protein KBB96_09335 [Luteolibacter ambystomatis]|uniref:Uncharacterized protein n=1 Tax=Luteolibacter ambystomatis TaxID=2824561 RepID=A0A975PHA6_9BACT|nr:hypothetical protein [Luteolibacter ambystomatis]QUE53081.1 hypothetical protein KBB96_09335 [Luteolibacter ambystomatis]